MRRFSLTRETLSPQVDPALWFLAAVMVLVHLLPILAGLGIVSQLFREASVYHLLGFFAEEFSAAIAGESFSIQLWWSFVTYAFVHVDFLHLGVNLTALLLIGHLARPHIGLGMLLSVFFVSVVGGAVIHGLIAEPEGVLIGASGGVYGQFAACVVWFCRWLARRWYGGPQWLMLGVVVALVLVAYMPPLLLSIEGEEVEYGWQAHMGGSICGVLIALLSRPNRGDALD